MYPFSNYLSSVVLSQQVNLEGDRVQNLDIFLGIHAHLDISIQSQTSTSSMQHVESHLVFSAVIERSGCKILKRVVLPGSKHKIVHLNQNTGIRLVNLSSFVRKL